MSYFRAMKGPKLEVHSQPLVFQRHPEAEREYWLWCLEGSHTDAEKLAKIAELEGKHNAN